jgi:hypothetical protein
MNALMRMILVAFVGVLLTLGIFGLRFAYSPGDYQKLLQAVRRHEELKEWHRETWRHAKAIRQAAHEYIVQRCTLVETMQRLQELELQCGQEWPAYGAFLRQPGPFSDEERYYALIIAYGEDNLRGRPDEAAAFLRRLEKDYQQLRADRNRPSAMPTKRTELSR